MLKKLVKTFICLHTVNNGVSMIKDFKEEDSKPIRYYGIITGLAIVSTGAVLFVKPELFSHPLFRPFGSSRIGNWLAN